MVAVLQLVYYRYRSICYLAFVPMTLWLRTTVISSGCFFFLLVRCFDVNCLVYVFQLISYNSQLITLNL